jgi:hypothetical protein
MIVEYLTRYALWPGETVGAHSRKGLRSIGKQTVVTMGGLGSWMQGNAMPEIVTLSPPMLNMMVICFALACIENCDPIHNC